MYASFYACICSRAEIVFLLPASDFMASPVVSLTSGVGSLISNAKNVQECNPESFLPGQAQPNPHRYLNARPIKNYFVFHLNFLIPIVANTIA